MGNAEREGNGEEQSDRTENETEDGVDGLSRHRFLKLLSGGAVGAGVAYTGAGRFLGASTEETSSSDGSCSADDGRVEEEEVSGFDPNDGFASTDWVRSANFDVVKVTNLDSDGPGSLSWAVDQEGPTLIVFEVGGVIDMEGQTYIRLDESETYIAGQTAPSPGITIIRGGIRIHSDNTIVQHIRCRVGDQVDDPAKARAFTYNDESTHVVIDHCSASWAPDQVFNVRSNGDGADNYTATNNLLAEGLYGSVHPEQPHSRAFHIHYDSQRVAAMGNLMAHHNRRHPYCQGNTSVAWVNNYVYNPAWRWVHLGTGSSGSVPPRLSFVGNVYEAGPDSSDEAVVMYDGEMYWEDNLIIPGDQRRIDGKQTILHEPPVWPEGMEAMAADRVKDTVVRTAGARPADRTPHDERIIEDCINGGGGLIDSQDDVGGYPDLRSTQRELNPPSTGLMDWLEQYTREVEQHGESDSRNDGEGC